MKITRDFRPLATPLQFRHRPCSYASGFAQVDTLQDAPYFGTWCSPTKLMIVTFTEGDLTTTVCDTDAEFIEQIHELAKWNSEAGYGPMKIDAIADNELRQAFEKLGLADLLH